MADETLQIKKNTFFVKKKPNNKLPNSLITYFLIMQFVYGFNFGFIDILNRKIRNFCKHLSLLVCLYNIIVLFIPVSELFLNLRLVRFLLYFSRYCGHIILLNFSKYKVYNFITDIRSICVDNIHLKERKIGWCTCIFFWLYFIVSMTVTVGMCIITNRAWLVDNRLLHILYQIVIIGLDVIVVVQLILNTYTYYAVIDLEELAENENVTFIKKQFICISEYCEKIAGHYGNLVSGKW